MDNERKIKVVLLEPGKLARITEIDASLNGMQKIVGGFIEPSYPFKENVCIVANEEGKVNRLPLNRAIYGENKEMLDIIAGTAFICDCQGENFDSLSDEQLQHYMKLFKNPEMFFHEGQDIKAIPYAPKKEQER